MHKCEYLEYGFDVEGNTIAICKATTEQCPRKRERPPHGHIGQSCWKVD